MPCVVWENADQASSLWSPAFVIQTAWLASVKYWKFRVSCFLSLPLLIFKPNDRWISRTVSKIFVRIPNPRILAFQNGDLFSDPPSRWLNSLTFFFMRKCIWSFALYSDFWRFFYFLFWVTRAIFVGYHKNMTEIQLVILKRVSQILFVI